MRKSYVRNPHASVVGDATVQTSYLIPAPADATERLLRETPETEQPLARLERLGPAVLSSAELLQVLLHAKADPLLPLRLMATWETLNQMSHAGPLDLIRVEGMTHLRSARLRAALELGKRAVSESSPERPIVRSPADAAQLLLPEMSGLPQEQMRVVLLNIKNAVIGMPMIYQGSLHTTVIRVGELFREAVRNNCAAMIVAHNHPSGGVPVPSPEDVAVTREIRQAGKILDIELMDHIVVGDGGHWISLKERGLGFD
jgi:DNA repair protein RadC